MPTVLCIEDEIAIRQDIVEELEDAGYQTLQAGDGIEGLETICKKKPDLVLCDITMPRMDGRALLTEIRERHPEFADLPFLFLSALADRKDVLAGLAVGADDYLTKPIDYELLLVRLDSALRQVDRMRVKKEQEQVKLFQALSKKFPQSPAQESKPDPREGSKPDPSGPKSDIGAVGKLRYVNLDNVRAQLGEEKWNQLSDKAMQICEKVIRANLEQGDRMIRQGNAGFCLIFPNLNTDAAQDKCERIAREVYAWLLGDDEELRHLALKSKVKAIGDLTGPDGKLDPNKLAAEWEENVGRRDEEEIVAFKPGKTRDVDNALRKQVSIKFQPVWNGKTEKVVAYQAIAYETISRSLDKRERLHRCQGIDVMLLERVTNHLETSAGNPDKAAVILPIHACTLLGPLQGRLKEMLESRPEAERRKLIIIELVPTDPEMPDDDFINAAAIAKSLTGTVFLRASPWKRLAKLSPEHGITALSWRFTSEKDASAEDDAADLSRVASEVRKLGLHACVYDLNIIRLIKAATTARFTFIGGPAVAREKDLPGDVFPLEKRRLFYS